LIGFITSLAPLEVQPRGATNGRPVQLIGSHVDTSGWVADVTRVLCVVEDGYLVVLAELEAP